MPNTSSRFGPLVLSAALIAAGCQDDGSKVTGTEQPESVALKGVTVLLRDAPGDFVAAVVTISEIYFQGDGGRVVLLDEPFTTDLLALQNAYATVVQGVIVPPGSYSQLRAVVTGAYIEVEDAAGTRTFASSVDYSGLPAGARIDGELQMPSWGSSGFKVEMPDGKLEVGGGQTIVLIDFDVRESFGREAGRSGRWILRPRVTATDVTFGGNLLARLQLGTGVTLPAINGQPLTLGAFTARLTPAGGGATKQFTPTDANSDGIFEALFTGLVPGAYTLDFTAPAGLIVTWDPTLPRTVTVASNQTTTETITVGSAQLAGTITARLGLGAGVTLPTLNGTPVTLAQFKAQLTPPGGGTPAQVAFSDANNDGTFEAVFGGLVAGAYSLTLLPPAGVTATFNPVVPVSVTLSAGATETRAFTVTAASGP